MDFTGGLGVLGLGHNHENIIASRIKFQEKNRMEVHKIVFSQYMAALSHNIACLLPPKPPVVAALAASAGTTCDSYCLVASLFSISVTAC